MMQRPERVPATGGRSIVMMIFGIIVCSVLLTIPLTSYPLDGYEHSGIRRLKAYERIQEGTLAGTFTLPPGALYPSEAIVLRLTSQNTGFDISSSTPTDPVLQRGLDRIVGAVHSSYRAAVVDITEPERPRYAAIRGNEGYIPGSVGKLLVMTGPSTSCAGSIPTRSTRGCACCVTPKWWPTVS